MPGFIPDVASMPANDFFDQVQSQPQTALILFAPGVTPEELGKELAAILARHGRTAVVDVQPVIGAMVLEAESDPAVLASVLNGIAKEVSKDGLEPDLVRTDGNRTGRDRSRAILDDNPALLRSRQPVHPTGGR